MTRLALAFLILTAGGAFAVGSLVAPDVTYAAGKKKNFGGGPGNSGPGDKNSQNEKGHGGQPTG